jgi:hypothetical protein
MTCEARGTAPTKAVTPNSVSRNILYGARIATVPIHLDDSRVRQLEIRFPVRAVSRVLPAADHRASVGGDRCGAALRELRSVAPPPPHVVLQGDFISPRHTTLVKVQHRAFPSRVVRAEDRDPTRNLRFVDLRLHDQEGAARHPSEGSAAVKRRARNERVRPDRPPRPHQDVQVLERRVWLRRLVVYQHSHIQLTISLNSSV